MLELRDQAEGLQACWAPAADVRILPVPAVQHGGASHRLLWLLARRLARQGDPVLVIDGLADEAPGAGLLAMLDAGPGGTPTPDHEMLPGIHIVSGRRGMLRLANQAHQAGEQSAAGRLASLVPAGTWLLVTAPVDVLAVCLLRSTARPLVAMDAQPRSLVEAYNAVKVLLQAGEMRPILVPLQPAAGATKGGVTGTTDASVEALARCAHMHLGEDLQIWPVAYDDFRLSPGDRVPEAWWLKVLDSALLRPGVMAGEEPESRRN